MLLKWKLKVKTYCRNVKNAAEKACCRNRKKPAVDKSRKPLRKSIARNLRGPRPRTYKFCQNASLPGGFPRSLALKVCVGHVGGCDFRLISSAFFSIVSFSSSSFHQLCDERLDMNHVEIFILIKNQCAFHSRITKSTGQTFRAIYRHL